jgi:hypothetical protein
MRSVVRKPTARCPHCQLPPRWCICAAQQVIACPLQIDLLIHPRELSRPSSTGNLVARLMPAARQHVWYHDTPPTAADFLAGSVIRAALPDFLERFHTRRPLEPDRY